MLVNSVLMIVISVFDNSKQRFDSILMMVNSVLNSTCLPVQPNQPKSKSIYCLDIFGQHFFKSDSDLAIEQIRCFHTR